MSPAESIADLTLAHRDATPVVSGTAVRDRNFPVGFACALALHMSLMIGFGAWSAPPRHIGDPAGNRDAISVEMIGPSDIEGMEAGAPASAPAPVSPLLPPQETASPAEPPPALRPSVQPETAPPQPPAERTTRAEPIEAPPAAQAKRAAPAPAPDATAPALEPAVEPPLATPPAKPDTGKEARTEAAKKRPQLIDKRDIEDLTRLDTSPLVPPKSEPKQKTAAVAIPDTRAKPSTEAKPKSTKSSQQLDLSLPSSPAGMSFDSGVGGMQRPAGITRSGENDDFAREVIRALRRVMPQLRLTGRATIRLTLNEKGNFGEVKLLATSGLNDLDQAVMFSTKQASYPIPPSQHIALDRVFIITYIYH